MKKILFVTPHMICGGVEKSLIALINEISLVEYQIKILMVKAEGELLEYIPKNIIIGELPLLKKTKDELLLGGTKKNLFESIKQMKFLKAGKILVKKIILNDSVPELSEKFDNIEAIDDKYDIAVAYHMHMPFIVRYVADKIKADKKVVWIHNDFNVSGFNPKLISNSLYKYNKIYAVSNQVKNEFISILPQYKTKTEVFHNIISKNTIKLMADNGETYCDEFDGVRILSIGRLDIQKGFDVAIKVCKKLIDENVKVKWYVIGEGNQRKKLEKLINENKLNDTFCLMGTIVNPYRYLKECDIYVQPSRHEGYGIALAEAKSFCKPIVTTNFAGAREQLINNVNGIICDFSEESIFHTIKILLNDRNKREKFSKELAKAVEEDINIDKFLKLSD